MSRSLLEALLAWSTLSVLLAWRAPPRWQLPGIAACGAGLLATVAPLSLAWLLAGTVLCRQVVQRWPSQGRVVGATVALITVAYGCGLWLGRPDPAALAAGHADTVLLPLGAAYYALRLVHYLLEGYKGGLRPHGWPELLAWLWLPSALPVGPVHRFDEFLRDLRRRRWDGPQFSLGLERVLLGLFKVVVLGNVVLALKVEPALADTAARADGAGLYVAALLMWAKLYVLFSGCSDLAIGFGAMAGFTLRENFHHPFGARNIVQFWQRWHMSLSSWCRDYVFTPTLAHTRRPGLAVVAAMLVLGLWHALSLHYLLWGLYHGLALALFRRAELLAPHLPTLPPWAQPLRTAAAMLLTWHVVLFSFPVSRAVEAWLSGLLSGMLSGLLEGRS